MDVLDSQIAVCSWSLQPDGIDDLIRLTGQTGISGIQLALEPLRREPEAWTDAAAKLEQAGLHTVSGMFQPAGEDYTTLQSIHDTGGVVPDQTWEANWSNMQRCSVLAQGLSIRAISLHAGFIPGDTGSRAYETLIERIRRIADLIGDMLHGQLWLETGQETADHLLTFLDSVNRTNVGVNFDPANMILYNQGDPIDALRQLLPHIRQVHIKDACYTTVPGQWGKEVPVGQGDVDWQRFLRVLADADYEGRYVIEREAGPDRTNDVILARDYIRRVGS